MSKAADAFPLDRPWIEPYAAAIRAAGAVAGVSPAILAGIMSRESGGGRLLRPQGPAGTGDGGNGRGLMQIDRRFHRFAASGNWRDPRENIFYGAQLLRVYIDRAGDLRAGIAMYNTGASALASHRAGRDPDETTTGGDYSRDVIERAELFAPILSGGASRALPLILIAAAVLI